MGGQETLLLVARHPRLLAGAAAMDSVTDLTRRYAQLPQLGQHGLDLQSVLRREVGGRPDTSRRAYEARSPMSLASRIAFSRVPLQVWWSSHDKIVFDQAHQSAALYKELRRLNGAAQLTSYSGSWRHSSEMRSTALLPLALMDFGLLPRGTMRVPASVARATTL
jgi:pimeloyl-ACP methyl ester carboxylesterase